MYVYDPSIAEPRGAHPHPELDGLWKGYRAPIGNNSKRLKKGIALAALGGKVGIDGLIGGDGESSDDEGCPELCYSPESECESYAGFDRATLCFSTSKLGKSLALN